MSRKAKRSPKPVERCPTCGREFKSFRDFPALRVLSFERLSLPESLDYMSDAAAMKQLAWRRNNPSDPAPFESLGINMTPEVARACEVPQVTRYLKRLEETVGNVIQAAALRPRLKAHGLFEW